MTINEIRLYLELEKPLLKDRENHPKNRGYT